MKLPSPPQNIDAATRAYLESLVRAVDQGYRDVVLKDRAINHVLLLSPNKSVYSVTVEDDGTLVTTLLAGG